MRICNEAVQIHGGYGYIREFAAERHLRDVARHDDLRGHERDPAHRHRAQRDRLRTRSPCRTEGGRYRRRRRCESPSNGHCARRCAPPPRRARGCSNLTRGLAPEVAAAIRSNAEETSRSGVEDDARGGRRRRCAGGAARAPQRGARRGAPRERVATRRSGHRRAVRRRARLRGPLARHAADRAVLDADTRPARDLRQAHRAGRGGRSRRRGPGGTGPRRSWPRRARPQSPSRPMRRGRRRRWRRPTTPWRARGNRWPRRARSSTITRRSPAGRRRLPPVYARTPPWWAVWHWLLAAAPRRPAS